MKKQVASILITAVLAFSLIIPAVADNVHWEDDNSNANLVYYTCNASGEKLDSKEGSYSLGEYFYFEYDLWVSKITNKTVVNKLEIQAFEGSTSSDISGLQYYNGSDWVDGTSYIDRSANTKVLSNNIKTRFRVRFNRAAGYMIKATCTEINNEFRLVSPRYIEISDGQYGVYREKPTTEAPTTSSVTVSTTTKEMYTGEPVDVDPDIEEPVTIELITDEPETTKPTTVAPTTVAPTTAKPTTAEQTTAGMMESAKIQTTTKEAGTIHTSETTSGLTKNIKVGVPTIKKVKSAKKSLKLKWKKVKGANGYQIQASLKKKFTKIAKQMFVKNGNKVSIKIKKLKKKTKYFVRVRGYKVVTGIYYYSNWSKTKKKRTK